MKHSIIALMLMASLCLWAKSSYAYPLQSLIEPKCSECEGHGYTEVFGGSEFAVRTEVGMAKRLGGGWQLLLSLCGMLLSATRTRSKLS